MDPDDRERQQACEALTALVAILDEVEEQLDPGGGSAEQVAVLDRLAQLFRARLDQPLVRSPLSRLPEQRLAVSDVGMQLRRVDRARGAGANPRCAGSPPLTLVRGDSGVVAHSLGSIAGEPVLAWRQDCAAARQPCKTDGIRFQKLDHFARPVGPAVDAQVDVRQWDTGEPFVLRDNARGGLLLFGSDGDQLVQLLGPDLRRRGRPRLALVRSDRVAPRRFAARPGPAWLSLAERGRRMSLLRFDHELGRPLSRVLVLGPDQLGGAFGAPALWGGAMGYAVALTTVRRVHFARFDRFGAPMGPSRSLPLRFGGIIDPQCSVIARRGGRFYVLTVGTRAKDRPTAALIGFDAAGRYAGPAVALEFPVRLARGCPAWLLTTGRHLVVVAQARAPRHSDAHPLMMLEYKPDGRRVGLPVQLALVRNVGGVAGVDRGFVVAWQSPRTGSPAPEAVLGTRVTCR